MRKYNLAIISPGNEGSVVSGSWKNWITFYRLTIPLLAAYVDRDIFNLSVFDESVGEHIPLDGFDLVAMSVMTPYAPRAYSLSKEFRSRGAKVVLGGAHPSLLPQEALLHADAIAVGEGEITWPKILDDFRRGKMEGVYNSTSFSEVEKRVLPDRSVFRGKSLMTFGTVETSRGCPKRCAHCAVVATQGRHGYRVFDIDSILEDLGNIKGDYLFLVDDNPFGFSAEHEERVLFFLKQLKTLNKKWFCQATIEIGGRKKVLQAAAEAGCEGMYIGFESVRRESLQEVGKGWNRPNAFYENVRRIREDFGISIEGGFMFGFDHDTPDIFEQTAEFVYKSKIESPNAHILTSYPGTPLYERLLHQGRIITQDWSLYNTGNVVFRPKLMSPEELRAGYEMWYREVFSLGKTIKRIASSNFRHYSFLMNTAKALSVYKKFPKR